MPPTHLDTSAVGDLFRPTGDWVRKAGARVRKRRRNVGLTASDLARLCGVTEPTIYRVESGGFVPSDRLRAVIAYHLDARPETLWKFPTREQLEALTTVEVDA